MRDGKTVSIRYSDDELNRLEQAAAIAGYAKLSPYLRDKTLDKIGLSNSARDGVEAWSERQEVTGRLAEIERTQHAANAMLTTLLYLVHRKASTGDMQDLQAAVEHAGLSASTLDKIAPVLGKLIQQLQAE
ncbi:conjugal transfer protein TraA [Glaciimonas sp. GNP009]